MPFKFGSRKKSSSLSFSPALSKKLDHKLISKTKGGVFPSPGQLKYLGRFLTPGEKKLLALFTVLATLTTLLWAGFFLHTHLSRAPKNGGEYREVLIGEPKYINPLFASTNDVDSDLVSLIYSGLFRYNDRRELVPDLAEGYKVSPDGKVYDIKLRTGVRWSDGSPFTADDVVYTFELIQNPEVGSTLLAAFEGVEVKKVNDTTVRFTLKQSFAPFLESLTIGILPEHIWQGSDKPSTVRLAQANIHPIGTGPWRYARLAKGVDGTIQTYTLNRNENYYGQKPHLQTIIFTLLPDQASAIQKVHSQEIDGIAFPPRSEKDLLTSRNLATFSLELPQYTALFFNTQDALIKDKDLRSALRSGINKELILKEALQSQGTIIQSPFLPGMIGFNPNLKTIAFNPDEANALLDKKWTRIQPEEFFKLRKEQLALEYKKDIEEQIKASGTASSTTSTAALVKDEVAKADKQLTEVAQKEMSASQTFYRKDAKSNQILTIILTCLDTPEQQRVAEVVARQWQLLGIQTIIRRVSGERLSRDVLRGRTYQVLLSGELVGADPDPYPLWHSSQIPSPRLNFTQFNNRSADKLLEDGRSSLDPKVRAEAYKKFQDILVDEIPAIFLYTPKYSYVINKDIQGVRVGLLTRPSDRFNSLAEWYTKTKFIWK